MKAKTKATDYDTTAPMSSHALQGVQTEKPDVDAEVTEEANDNDGSGAINLDSLDLSKRTRLFPPRTLETTLFDRLERLYGEGIKRVLTIQYR